MLILRTIQGTNPEHNQELGSEYQLIKRYSLDDFDSLLKKIGVNAQRYKDVHSVITKSDHTTHIPLFEQCSYYVMSENGKTFANLSR